MSSTRTTCPILKLHSCTCLPQLAIRQCRGARAPTIEGPESTGHANTARLPLDTPPPEKAAEPPYQMSPEQIRAPVDAEGPLEPSRGKRSQCATWHKSQASARAFEGNKPLGEARGHPPNLLNLRIEDPIPLEQDIVVPKAWRPVFDKSARARPDPWPGPGTITTYSDAYPRASVLLEGEQKLTLPCEGSE